MSKLIAIFIFFILLFSNLFAVQRDSLATKAQVKDATISNGGGVLSANSGGRSEAGRNGGADGIGKLLNSRLIMTVVDTMYTTPSDTLWVDTTYWYDYTVIGIEDGQLSIPTDYSILKGEYHLKTSWLFTLPNPSQAQQPGDTVNYIRVGLYPVYNDWVEGSGKIGADTSFHSLFGCEWAYASVPGNRPAIPGSRPSSLDWRDNGKISAVKNQNPWGTCWCFAAIASAESEYKELVTGIRTFNSLGWDSACDQTVSPITTDGASRAIISATGWKKIIIPYDWATRAYYVSGTDCGYAIAAHTDADITINTAENSSNKPAFRLSVASRDITTGLSSDYNIVIPATYIEDVSIKGGADSTTNYGTETTARLVGSSIKYLIRVDSLRQRIDGLLDANDTLTAIYEMVDSFYVSTVNTAGMLDFYGLYKSKFVESQATARQWKADSLWGRLMATEYDELDLSEQQVLSCGGFDYEIGGQFSWAWETLINDSLTEEVTFPYQYPAPGCSEIDALPKVIRFGWYYTYNLTSPEDLKRLLTLQPLSISHQSSSNYINYVASKTNKCFYEASMNSTLGHATQLIGYNDDFVCDAGEGTGCWIEKNQYGTGWGENGFARIAYNTDYDISYIVYILSQEYPVPWVTGDQPISYVDLTTASTWYTLNIPSFYMEQLRNGVIKGFQLRQVNEMHAYRIQEEDGQQGAGGNITPYEIITSDDVFNNEKGYWIIESAPTKTIIGGKTIIGAGTNIGE